MAEGLGSRRLDRRIVLRRSSRGGAKQDLGPTDLQGFDQARLGEVHDPLVLETTFALKGCEPLTCYFQMMRAD